jgi:hypothetical protein
MISEKIDPERSAGVKAACRYLVHRNSKGGLINIWRIHYRKFYVRLRYSGSIEINERAIAEHDQLKDKSAMHKYFKTIGIKEFLMNAVKDYYKETGFLGWLQCNVAMRTHWARVKKDLPQEN